MGSEMCIRDRCYYNSLNALWIKNGESFAKGFGCESDKTASNVMNRGQCLAGEMFVHRSVSYLNLLGKNGFLRNHS